MSTKSESHEIHFLRFLEKTKVLYYRVYNFLFVVVTLFRVGFYRYLILKLLDYSEIIDYSRLLLD